MPRHPRRTEASNYFHVIVQGIEKKYIFERTKYKNKYYELIMKNAEKYDVKVLAYCIMDNHAHFLMYAEKIEKISICMKISNIVFAQMYNKEEKRVGYVFRDRFVSEPILSERQLYMCLAYIHFNPVKAGIVKNINQYFYSSYNDFLYRRNIVNSETLKCLFGEDKNYMTTFKLIHDIFEEYKVPAEVEKISDFEKVRKERGVEKLKDNCRQLKKEGLTVREIAEELKITKSKVARLLK